MKSNYVLLKHLNKALAQEIQVRKTSLVLESRKIISSIFWYLGSPLMSVVEKKTNPLVKRYKIEGITSLGGMKTFCRSGNWPGVFTNVSMYEEWIDSVMYEDTSYFV